MRKLNIFEKFVIWLRSMFINEKKREEISDELKKEMCGKVLQSGGCPHDCDRCAWNTLR